MTDRTRRQFLQDASSGLLGAAVSVAAERNRPPVQIPGARVPGRRPNILIIIADDATHSDLPLYGGQNIRTPHIDRLASEGMRFSHAYLTMAMCVPCRAELYTGLYPIRNGVCWNHSQARPGTRSVVHHLNELGYRVGLAGKVHATPKSVFPFEMVDGFERNCVADTASHDVRAMKEFVGRDKTNPFCLAIGLVVPHVPWTVGDPAHLIPERLKLPPYLVDTPETRKDFAKYLAELEMLDRQVGDILTALRETGEDERTLVLFTSEQGAQFPGCKWTNWEQGVHTALVARWPGRIRPDSQSDALVQYADVVPTLIDAAGADPTSKQLDGRSLLSVLLGQRVEHRRYVYGMHNNLPDSSSYPIRSIRTREFHYIRNLAPDRLYLNKWIMSKLDHNVYWPSWVWASGTDDRALRLVNRYMHRPAEELYRAGDGDFEEHNLAGDPSYVSMKRELSSELDRWMAEQKDPGIELDTWKAFNENKKLAG